MAKYKIVMVRHGESEWNLKNLFCGWYDADLSPKGIEEAKNAGIAIKNAGLKFDLAHTSVLSRAQKTLTSILTEIGQCDIPVCKTWRLNERHYGGLTGLNKAETAAKYGEDQKVNCAERVVNFILAVGSAIVAQRNAVDCVRWKIALERTRTCIAEQAIEYFTRKIGMLAIDVLWLESLAMTVYARILEVQDSCPVLYANQQISKKEHVDKVKIWRRSFDVPPPPMENDHPYYKQIVEDPRYADGPRPEEFPRFESLKLTIERTLPYWNDVIVPEIKAGKQILIAAHGNSLRGIVKYLDNMSEDDIMNLNLPTGIPFVYELDENLKPVVSLKFLGDEETVAKAMAAVAAQGKSK